jgi:hypothetical protein
MKAAKDTGVDVYVILAIGYVESRYNPLSVSRKQCKNGVCKRVTGVWNARTPPPGARPTYYCGVMQVGGNISWDECMKLRDDLTLNYLTGAKHVIEWQQVNECRKLTADDKLVCALRGYNGGYPAIARNARWYPNTVLSVARQLRRHANALNNI